MPDKTHFLARLCGVDRIAVSFEAALVEISRTRATPSGVARQRAAHAYFRRIDALDYTMLHGQRIEDPEEALAAKLR
jgi:regulator of PEP synthase PpsR (kinase-PPPase family)